MKTLKLIIPAILIVSVAMGQSKPRKVIIKKSATISKDSTYYLPDTIACVFKELVITPDTVYEKWNNGYVVWQTWKNEGNLLIGFNWYSGQGTNFISDAPVKNEYFFNQIMPGIFLYSNYKKVANKVIAAYSK